MSDLEYLANQIRMLVRAMGMQAENQIREHKGESPAYSEDDFINLINQFS